MKLILLKNADIYTPEHKGIGDILSCGAYILKVGKVDEKALAKTDLEIDIVDVRKNIVTPGFIDPHAHLLGGSGENGGFSSQTPEIALTEIIQGGVTTIVGTLGVDTTMKTMAGLLAKVKGLNDEGMSSYLYTGGYSMPPDTIMDNAKNDIMFIDEVIGTGEIAIADERSEEPSPEDLSKVVTQSYVGGMLAGKAGIAHFHVGEGKRRLACLRDLIEHTPDTRCEWLYPTHIERTEKLMMEAIAFTKKGSFVDIDVSEGELAKKLGQYRKHGGNLNKLTVSSDASINSPQNIIREIRNCIFNHRYNLETLLPLVTKNTAEVLKFKKKGQIEVDFEPSYVVFEKNPWKSSM